MQTLNPPSGPIGVAATPLGCSILGRRLALEHNCTSLSRPSFPPDLTASLSLNVFTLGKGGRGKQIG